jgi:amidase
MKVNELDRRGFLKKSVYATAACLTTGCAYNAASLLKEKNVRPFDELLDHDALSLAQLIKTKQIDSLELVEIIIKRIEATNPSINFITNEFYDRARMKAQSISLETPFAGVPILMKDMIDVGGVPRTDGSRLLLNNISPKNVKYVNGVELAGLNIIGMTNVPEFASYIMTDNAVFGATKNPWNKKYSPFTSSGGAAASVAAGVLPLAHGTDGAGSNRLPSSTTGLLGMKASYGRMLSGEASGKHDRTKTNQSISRTVRDSAALLNYTEDKSGAHYQPLGFIEQRALTRLRVGYVNSGDFNQGVEPEVVAAIASTANLLERLGHEVEEIELPFSYDALFDAYKARSLGKFSALAGIVNQAKNQFPAETNLITPWVESAIALSNQYNQEDLLKKTTYLNSIPSIFSKLFTKYDILLCPVSTVSGVALNEASYNDQWDEEKLHFVITRLKFTIPVNFGGNPAMSVPLYWEGKDGLPVGSHFIAAKGNDELLYQLAYELEEVRPWRDYWAPHSLNKMLI